MADSICSIEGCEGSVSARGWCNRHYLRWRNHGNPLGGGRSPQQPIDYPDDTRTCAGCGERQPIESFDLDARGRNGRRARCKNCRAVHMKGYYRANADEKRAYATGRRKSDPETVRDVDRARYERNRALRVESAIELTHVRRAIAAGVEFERGLTVSALREAFGDRCCYCSVEMDFATYRRSDAIDARKATVEHVLPLSRGGGHVASNTRLCCAACNSDKRSRTVEEWIADGARWFESDLPIGRQ